MATQAQLLQLVKEQNRVARRGRYPQHTHLVEYRPLQVQPFLIAPVLAGETLKNLNLQARVISDPLSVGAGNILPWWCEHYFYYVTARQLAKSQVEAMVLQGAALGLTDAANAKTYHVGGDVDWVQRALQFIVEEGGFRNEGEAWNASGSLLDGLPMAAAIRHRTNWADSLMPDGAITAENNLQNPHDPDVLLEYQEAYERMRAMRFIDMSFEDYLMEQGVNLSQSEQPDKPELLRVTSNWQYPSNTVDPVTGMPSGAASFSINERADKDRFFKEPGFIIGVTVARPKLFMGNQKSAGAIMMNDAFSFMPRIMADQPHTSVKEFVGGAGSPTGPLRNQTAGYWVDVRDLLQYGDQFLSYASANGFAPALPNAAGEKRYATSDMINAWFQSASVNKFRQDGVTRLSILSFAGNTFDQT